MTTTLGAASIADLPASRLDDDGFPVLRPTRLTIHRSSPLDVKDRQIIMSLDGRKLVTLLFGQQHTCEIPPGPHRLRANNTLVWKTVEFEAAPGEDVHYTCTNRAPGSLFYLLFLFGVGPMYVTLERGAPAGPAPS
jgi:hypothetical protein